MNTVELYVEPILIGALMLALLILPLAPELLMFDFARFERLKALSDVALAAVLVSAAYFVGILGDRLIDTCLQALERHNRVRFALAGLKVPAGLEADKLEGRKAAWHARSSGDPYPGESRDPFPEDTYRWWVFAQAERIADSLDYIRTRIRLLRALSFLLPGLVFAGALGAARLESALLCISPTGAAHSPRPIWCNQVDWMVASPTTEVSWLLLFFAPGLYAATIVTAAALDAWDSRRWRSRTTAWRRAGLWHPPHTASYRRMETYAEARGWPIDDWSQLNLWSDILAQPVVWCSVSLLLASIPAIVWLNSNSVSGSVVGVLAGPLLTVSAGWAWWRITGTFMGYLKSSGRFLAKKAEMSASDCRKA
jgi:hypothetical protein